MSEFQCRAPTNQSPNSVSNVPGYLMPARAFFFVVVEEVGKDGFLVMKIYASNKSPYLRDMNLSPLQQLSELTPERYGMLPKGPVAPYSIAEHVMGAARIFRRTFPPVRYFQRALRDSMAETYSSTSTRHSRPD